MYDYEKMYYMLFNKITDIIEELKTVQIQTEELFINTDNQSKKLNSHDENNK